MAPIRNSILIGFMTWALLGSFPTNAAFPPKLSRFCAWLLGRQEPAADPRPLEEESKSFLPVRLQGGSPRLESVMRLLDRRYRSQLDQEVFSDIATGYGINRLTEDGTYCHAIIHQRPSTPKQIRLIVKDIRVPQVRKYGQSTRMARSGANTQFTRLLASLLQGLVYRVQKENLEEVIVMADEVVNEDLKVLLKSLGFESEGNLYSPDPAFEPERFQLSLKAVR